MVEVLLKLDKSAILNKRESAEYSIAFNKVFNLYDIVLFNNNFVLVEVKNNDSSIKSVINKLSAVHGNKILYFQKLTNSQRGYLIENNISFFEATLYYFIPNIINIEFQKEIHQSEKFKAITQLVYIYILESSSLDITIDELVRGLKISKISASRSLNELFHYQILEYKFIGANARKKVYYYESKSKLYIDGCNYLQNPISKVIYIKKKLFDYKYVYSSATALSNLSLYEDNKVETIAVYKRGFKSEDFNFTIDGLNSNDYYCVELWNYDPCAFGGKNVDILSLQQIYDGKNNYRANIEIQRIIREKRWIID